MANKSLILLALVAACEAFIATVNASDSEDTNNEPAEKPAAKRGRPAKVTPPAEDTPADDADAEPEKPTAKGPTMKDVRVVLAKVMDHPDHGEARVAKLLAKVGASELPEVEPKDFQMLIDKANALLGD
jgi:hypothetical protein